MKLVAIVLAGIVIAGSCVYFLQQQKLQRLLADNENLRAQQGNISASPALMPADTTQREKDELARLQKENLELLRLRNEVSQLRQELNASRQGNSRSAPATAAAAQSSAGPGRYISKAELAFVGYATPEAALQSMSWAMMNGTYEQTLNSMAPNLAKEENKSPESRAQFEAGRQRLAPLFKGMQILARKTLADDRVELKVKMDGETPNQPGFPDFVIQPMVKIGDEWKLGGSTRSYQPSWDENGQIQPLAP